VSATIARQTNKLNSGKYGRQCGTCQCMKPKPSPTPAPDDWTIVLGADGYDITHLSPFARWKRENYLADVRRGVYRRHPQHDDQPLQ